MIFDLDHSMFCGKLINDRIYKVLHDLEFVFFGVASNLIDDVLHGIYKILKGHLILVDSCPHDLDENQMIVILCNFLAGHASEFG